MYLQNSVHSHLSLLVAIFPDFFSLLLFFQRNVGKLMLQKWKEKNPIFLLEATYVETNPKKKNYIRLYVIYALRAEKRIFNILCYMIQRCMISLTAIQNIY